MRSFYKLLLTSALWASFFNAQAIQPRGEGSDQPKHPLARKLGQSKEFKALIERIRAPHRPFWEKTIAPQVDHVLKVLSNRHVKNVMPDPQHRMFAERLSCIMDAGLFDLVFAQREIDGLMKELEVYRDFLPSPGFDEEAQRARAALLKDGLRGDGMLKVAHVKTASGVFKSRYDRSKFMAAKFQDKQRISRNTRLELACAQVASVMDLSHVVVPVAQIKEGGYEGNLEKSILLLTEARKKELLQGMKTKKLSPVLAHLSRPLDFYATKQKLNMDTYLKNLRGLDLDYVKGHEVADLLDRVPVQHLQDLFLFVFVTAQRDATMRNLMVDASDPKDIVRLILTDTEYAFVEDPKDHRAPKRKFDQNPDVIIPFYDPEFFNDGVTPRQPLTPETVQKIKALNLPLLRATLKEFYPEMLAEDLLSLERRVNFLKDNVGRFFNNKNTIRGIWNQYFHPNDILFHR